MAHLNKLLFRKGSIGEQKRQNHKILMTPNFEWKSTLLILFICLLRYKFQVYCIYKAHLKQPRSTKVLYKIYQLKSI